MSDTILPSGDLREWSFQKILHCLDENEKTGVLDIEKGTTKKSIYVENRNVVFASSNDAEDRLGEHLVKADKLTPGQRDESLEVSQKRHKRYGETLLELGLIVPKDLFLELKNQMLAIIHPLFSWKDGTYTFNESPSLELIKIKVSISSIISEGLNRLKNGQKEDQGVFIREINGMYDSLGKLGYYEILGLDYEASLDEIKAAYLKKVQRYHPDRYRHLSNNTVEAQLTEIFSFVNEAYQILGNSGSKEKYDASLIHKGLKRAPVDDHMKVKDRFHVGVNEYNKGNFWGAADLFRWVTQQSPDNAEYWAYFCLALGRIPRKKKEAEAAIRKAIELKPHNARYHVHLGLLYVEAGLKKRAALEFIAALDWDPTNDQAKSELEKLNR
jgi:tetratricopeptide (TPR) repeat protein